MALIVVGASLQTSAYQLSHLIVGRVITGLGTGIDSSTVPMYQSELSRKEWRGRLVSWEIWFIGLGISLAYWIVRLKDGSPGELADIAAGLWLLVCGRLGGVADSDCYTTCEWNSLQYACWWAS